MADLILLSFENEEPIRCIDLVNATSRVKARGSILGKAVATIIPEKGSDDNHVMSLEFDALADEWVPVSA